MKFSSSFLCMLRNLRLTGFLLLLAGWLLPNTAFAQAKPEFRAVWVATVDNIDWPSKGNYNSDLQKIEFTKLLDMHLRNGINAVIVQVRPVSDAFYPSPFEPWSEFLTGIQGKPPEPYYDPLAFMITEAHKRGMEFHAWMNPYRAVFNIGRSSIAANHITRIHPEWFLTYGDKKYFDPGNKDAQQYLTNVVKDVVERYAIDAIHFDDYFYPYKIPGKEFPDHASFRKYGNGMNKDDWRRSNTDSIISRLNAVIKKANPKCQFGISPFGVWRNQDKDPVNGSKTNGAQTNYDDLYADILLWLQKGWIDYVAPQLYWEFGHRIAPYEVLLDWWSKNTFGKNLYIGLASYRANSNTAWKDHTQLPRQIEALRNTPNIQGMIFYNSSSFVKNPNGWNDSLRNNYFRLPVYPAPLAWIDSIKPEAPQINSIGLRKRDSFYQVKGNFLYPWQNIKKIAVYVYEDNKVPLKPELENIFYFNADSSNFVLIFPIDPLHKTKKFGVSTISRYNVESTQQLFNWQDLED